jgi:glycosyltransferase involved in cell wall biosynthesis
MSAGLPVVATGVGDIPLIVKPDFGNCVPAHQPAQIAAALRDLIENPDKRISFGTMAREYVIQNHSASGWMDQLLNAYHKVISDRG